jgi:hypothetical protein
MHYCAFVNYHQRRVVQICTRMVYRSDMMVVITSAQTRGSKILYICVFRNKYSSLFASLFLQLRDTEFIVASLQLAKDDAADTESSRCDEAKRHE